ncbi:MAG: SDR family oxidoreductase [Chloroflexi bacterium]|nr:SDR family oxidoreductase [Chloroflexota bacterium]
MFRLDGRVALITGSGQGIGLATALALAGQGADLAIVDLEASRAEAAAEQVRTRGQRVLALSADVTAEDQVGRMVERVASELGRLDILVNNVGGSGGSAIPLEDTPLEVWERVMAFNVRSAFLTTRAAIPHLKRQGGRVVLLSSMAGTSRTIIGGVVYATAKAALLGFTRQLAQELGPSGITVNAIAPGVIHSERIERAFAAHPTARLDRVIEQIPLGRLGRVEDLAAAIAYLCSDEATYVTGVTLEVNGGINTR